MASSTPVRAVLSVKLALARYRIPGTDTVIKNVLPVGLSVGELSLRNLLDVLSADEVYVQESDGLEAINDENIQSARAVVANGGVLVAVRRDVRDDSGLERLTRSMHGLERRMQEQSAALYETYETLSEALEVLGRKVGELEQRVEQQRLGQGRCIKRHPLCRVPENEGL